MDAATALRRFTSRATAAFDQAAVSRERLTNALTVQGAQLDLLMDAVLTAEGKAKPWADLMTRIEHHGVREGLAQQRAEALEVLLRYGVSMSTSPVTNAMRLAERDGLRRFLDATDTLDIDKDPEPTAADRA